METKKCRIALGCHVDFDFVSREGRKDFLSVDIVPDELADFDHGFLGVGTPLAKILLGEMEGTIIPYFKDDIYSIEILGVSPSLVKPDEGIQAERQAKINRIMREVEHTNAVIFASSFSGKWGDYDPDSLPKIEKSAEEETDESK